NSRGAERARFYGRDAGVRAGVHGVGVGGGAADLSLGPEGMRRRAPRTTQSRSVGFPGCCDLEAAHCAHPVEPAVISAEAFSLVLDRFADDKAGAILAVDLRHRRLLRFLGA